MILEQIKEILDADERFKDFPTPVKRDNNYLASVTSTVTKQEGSAFISLIKINEKLLRVEIEYGVDNYDDEFNFEGFIESVDDFNRVLVMLGINEKKGIDLDRISKKVDEVFETDYLSMSINAMNVKGGFNRRK